MTPFSVQNLIMKLQNMSNIKNNIVAEKFNFCVSFEQELGLQNSKYSEEVFDYLYNIHDYKRIFKPERFKQILTDIMDANFMDFSLVMQYINQMYQEMVYLNRDFIYELFNIKHEDPEHITLNFLKNKNQNIEKFLKHF